MLGWKYEPEPDSDEEDSDFDSEEEDQDQEEDYEDGEGSRGKRRSLGDGDRVGKRRKLDQPSRMSREERDAHSRRLEKHYMAGTWYGQSASGTVYILATVLERVDNELLWYVYPPSHILQETDKFLRLAILGLTYQYTTSRISRDSYDTFQSIYADEVARLNVAPASADHSLISLNPDDLSIRPTEELRFMLFRHWTLYDAMFHSSYVASKLGIWKERGRKRLTGLLAKMG